MPVYIAILSVIELLVAPSTAAAFQHLPSRSVKSVTCPHQFHSQPHRSAPRLTRLSMVDSNHLSPVSLKKAFVDDGKTIADKDVAASCAIGPTKHVKPTNQHNPSPLAGIPIGPVFGSPSKDELSSDGEKSKTQPVVVRYMYEGGHIAQGRLCHLFPLENDESSVVTVPQLISTLIQDGVDMDTFYACVYETSSSDGGWLPLEKGRRWHNPFDQLGDWKQPDSDTRIFFPLANVDGGKGESIVSSRRIDIKLFRRPRVPSHKDHIANHLPEKNPLAQSNDRTVEHSLDALQCISSSIPAGKMPIQGYFGIAILQPKTSSNIGTLLRSAYQLGASIVYTIGGRYKPNSTDTLNVPARVPLVELNDWNAFVSSSPRSAVWVVIEMGGTPLSQFRHPRNAIYILGSEDHGVPKSVLRGCREVVSLEAEEYGSYNVAVAGSIVMYDRMVKMRREQMNEEREERA